MMTFIYSVLHLSELRDFSIVSQGCSQHDHRWLATRLVASQPLPPRSGRGRSANASSPVMREKPRLTDGRLLHAGYDDISHIYSRNHSGLVAPTGR
jgi:hypothetical protein